MAEGWEVVATIRCVMKHILPKVLYGFCYLQRSDHSQPQVDTRGYRQYNDGWVTSQVSKPAGESMISHSRQTIHMGINFVFSPVPVINRHSHIRFQQGLMDAGVDFKTTSLNQGEILVIRENPSQLNIRVASLDQPPAAQFLVVAPHLGCDVEVFAREVDAVLRAFEATWPSNRRQVLSCDSTFRDLFETSAKHAFQELWEMRLGQSSSSLDVLGRPVLGGGLRFVMPNTSDDPEPMQVEVKIESYLQDTKKLFIETEFKWLAPTPQGAPFDPSGRLKQIDNYVENQVVSFVEGGSSDGGQ